MCKLVSITVLCSSGIAWGIDSIMLLLLFSANWELGTSPPSAVGGTDEPTGLGRITGANTELKW